MNSGVFVLSSVVRLDVPWIKVLRERSSGDHTAERCRFVHCMIGGLTVYPVDSSNLRECDAAAVKHYPIFIYTPTYLLDFSSLDDTTSYWYYRNYDPSPIIATDGSVTMNSTFGGAIHCASIDKRWRPLLIYDENVTNRVFTNYISSVNSSRTKQGQDRPPLPATYLSTFVLRHSMSLDDE